MKYLFVLSFLISNYNLSSQKTIFIVNAETQERVIGALVHFPSKNERYYTDLEGSFHLSEGINTTDSFYIRSLGYQFFRGIFSDIKDTIRLVPSHILLKETIIKPISPQQILIDAQHRFVENHCPFPFYQNVFYREELLEKNDIIRFQEMELKLYQFPWDSLLNIKYPAGSYPEVLSYSRLDDSVKMHQIEQQVGRYVSKKIHLDQMSLYSYVKGGNALGRIFSYLLTPSKYNTEISYHYLGQDTVQGETCHHIEVVHTIDGKLLNSSHIFIEVERLAVLAFKIYSIDNNATHKLLDFKTKVGLWFLGLKVQVKQYYCQLLFEKNEQNVYTMSDVQFIMPIDVTKKNTLHTMTLVQYRVDSKMNKCQIPNGTQIYNKNKNLFSTTRPFQPLGKKLKNYIPLNKEQQMRLSKKGVEF